MVSLMKVQVYVWIGTGLCGLWHGVSIPKNGASASMDLRRDRKHSLKRREM